jgi:two-component system NtrC family sensor kinase
MIKKKGFFYFVLFFILLLNCNCYSQEVNFDSIKDKLDHMQKDNVWIEKTSLLFDQMIERDISKAEILNHEFLAASRKLKIEKGIALGYKERGDLYYYKLQFDSSKIFLDSAFTVYQNSDDKKGIASVLTSMGINYIINRQELKGAEMLYKSLELCENSNDNYLTALNYENLGLINDRIRNYQKAESYHRKALELFKHINNNDKIVFVQYNYGTSLIESYRFQEALNYLKEGAALCEKIQNNFFLTGFYEGIGSCYLMMDTMNLSSSGSKDSLIHQALYYLKKSEKEIYDHGYSENLANINTKIGFIYFRMGDYEKAISYNKNALDLAKKSHLLNILTDANRQLFEIYVATGNPSKALEFHQQYKFWNDSMYSAEKSNKIEHLYQQFESEKKEKEIQLLKSENEIQRLKAERGQFFNYALASGIIVLIILTFIYFNQSKKRQKINLKLQQAYTDLGNAQEQLIQQEKLSLLGKLASRMAHEIQNPLNFVNNFSELSEELTDEFANAKTEEDRNEIIGSLKQNLSKINHHGKRAEGIIKKVEQHLRDGTGLEFFEE